MTDDGKKTDFKEIIRNACIRMGIPCFGIADPLRWETPLFDPWIPEEFRPRSIYPETESVIVIGLPVHLPALESAPSIWYREEYKTVNRLLDNYAWIIASLLNEHGHSSVSVPRDGYGSIRVLLKNPVAFFSHRHAAVLAGLGTIGRNNMVLTPGYGPRMRFASIFTSVRIKPDEMLTESLCTRCNTCIRACPVNALDGEDYPEGLTNKRKCASRSESLNSQYLSPCGICIKVCPVGTDRDHYSRNDIRIYEEPEKFRLYHKAWDHVRKYGVDIND